MLESNNGLLQAILEDPKRQVKKKDPQKSSDLTRDGLKASQNLIEFSMHKQPNQNQSWALMSSSSGVLDPQGEVKKFTSLRNNRALLREEPDYSRKHTIQNMMAKRQ